MAQRCLCVRTGDHCVQAFTDVCAGTKMCVCVHEMLAADGRGLGGVRVWGHGVRADKWIAAPLWSLPDSNPSQPALSDEGWQMTSSLLCLAVNPFRVHSPSAEPDGETPPLGRSVGERWVEMSFKTVEAEEKHFCSWSDAHISRHPTGHLIAALMIDELWRLR